jgi:serine/threonine protein kinase
VTSVLADRYELRVRIASGGMATVWRAFDRRLGREVAVKVLSESLAADERFRRRFEREAQHIASLSHPNIVVVHDAGIDGDQLFIVMELVKGRSLRQLLAESAPLPPPMIARLAADVSAGLGHAHEADILHRDIKPGNILVTESGVSKLADFGIAKATEETVDITDSGAILGTVSYASPEQLSGDPLGPSSDLYSLGCVLYECAAGRPPFVADNLAALVTQQQFSSPEPLGDVSPEVPPQLGDTIMQALRKDPAQRFDSAGEMGEAFGAFYRGAADHPPRPSTTEHPARPRLSLHRGRRSSGSDNGSTGSDGGSSGVSGNRRRRRWWVGVAAGFVVLAIAGAVVGLTRGGSPPSTSMDTSSKGTSQPGMGSDVMSFSGGATGSLTTVEKQLRNKLNPDLQGTCHGYSHESWEHSVGAIRCTWPHDPITVTYVQLENAKWMTTHFNAYYQEKANSPPQGNCETASNFTAFQPTTTRFTEGGYTEPGSPPAASGSLICFHEHGVPMVVWTNDMFNVIAKATATAGSRVSSSDLLSFWSQNAGPYGQP